MIVLELVQKSKENNVNTFLMRMIEQNYICLEMFMLMFIKILIIKKNSNHPEYLHNRLKYLVITNDYNQKSNQNFYFLLNLIVNVQYI